MEHDISEDISLAWPQAGAVILWTLPTFKGEGTPSLSQLFSWWCYYKPGRKTGSGLRWPIPEPTVWLFETTRFVGPVWLTRKPLLWEPRKKRENEVLWWGVISSARWLRLTGFEVLEARISRTIKIFILLYLRISNWSEISTLYQRIYHDKRKIPTKSVNHRCQSFY